MKTSMIALLFFFLSTQAIVQAQISLDCGATVNVIGGDSVTVVVIPTGTVDTSSFTPSSHGKVALISGLSYNYTASGSYSGSDSFVVTANDSLGNTANCTVNIDVAACVPTQTCATANATCGPIQNGCQQVYCGPCSGEDYCIVSQCVNCPSGACFPLNVTAPISPWCSDWSDCSFHGTCQSNGNCRCDDTFDGNECSKCASGYENYPSCTVSTTGNTTSTTASAASTTTAAAASTTTAAAASTTTAAAASTTTAAAASTTTAAAASTTTAAAAATTAAAADSTTTAAAASTTTAAAASTSTAAAASTTTAAAASTTTAAAAAATTSTAAAAATAANGGSGSQVTTGAGFKLAPHFVVVVLGFVGLLLC